MAKRPKKPNCPDGKKAKWFDQGGGKGKWECVDDPKKP